MVGWNHQGAGKCFTFSSGLGGEPWCVEFADFLSVNTPTTANLIPPTLMSLNVEICTIVTGVNWLQDTPGWNKLSFQLIMNSWRPGTTSLFSFHNAMHVESNT